MDDIDHDSAHSARSSDHEPSGIGEDPEDAASEDEPHADVDRDAGIDEEFENEDVDPDGSPYESEDAGHKGHTRSISASRAFAIDVNFSSSNAGPVGLNSTAALKDVNEQDITNLKTCVERQSRISRPKPAMRTELLTAQVYDIVPTIAAPHSTSINAICATRDLRWVFSGGADGYIRKFNWIDTANGKSMLTVAQRHPFVDSVTKAAVLMSYWENGDENSGKLLDENVTLSPVYSLASQREGLWLLSGLDSGGISLQSVRHEEGKQIAYLRGHTSAVSVLQLAEDECSVLSGSWDKTVLDWDLNTGKVIRSFEGSGGQISALETRPSSSVPIPEVNNHKTDESLTTFSTGTNERARQSTDAGDNIDGTSKDIMASRSADVNESAISPADSLFGGSLFGDDKVEIVPPAGTFVDDEDDEFSRAIANGLRDQKEGGDLENDEIQYESSIGYPLESRDDASWNPDPADGTRQGHEGMSTVLPSDGAGAAVASVGSMEVEKHVLDGQSTQPLPSVSGSIANLDSTFLAASIDGSIRIWDKRQRQAAVNITPINVPPWCMNATWSPDGNTIYAGRRNGTVDEYSLYGSLREPDRSFKLPNNSGAVSAVRAMPNGRHLLCASFDIIRLYDLQQKQIFKHATVPFLIVPGHRTGVVSQLYIDPACKYLISVAGNRGWDGMNTEVLLGYEIGVPAPAK